MRHRFVLLLPLLAGCFVVHNGSREPDGWAERRIGSRMAEADEAARDRQPRFQVMVMYGHLFSHHTAVRITSPGRNTVCWDPGGFYDSDREGYRRDEDVVTAQAPNLQQWWERRNARYGDMFMEVFEWDVEKAEADRLQDALLDQLKGNPEFGTNYVPGFCCVGVCDYLNRYTPAIDPGGTHVMPHNLGWRLWDQGPDRVLVFSERRGVSVFTRAAAGPPAPRTTLAATR